MRSPLAATLLALALASSCASKPPKPGPVPAANQRIKDSRTEKLADMPGIDKHSSPDAVEQRFGMEEARKRREERNRRDAEARARAGVVDKKAEPPPPPPP